MPPPTKPAKPAQKPIVYGKPDKGNIWMKALPWVFVLLGIGAITTMISHNSKQKPLVCEHQAGIGASLNSFGTCSTE
ncbi:MAG: hypothetical protein WCD70_09080 [Alphaproteobacteria bacterium]